MDQINMIELSGNNISQIPPEISKMSNLYLLRLDNNQLREIPAEIGLLKNLEGLFLNDNFLEKLPNQIGRLNSLDILDLNRNELRSLPEELCKLSARIDFQGNIDLDTIPPCFDGAYVALDFVEAINRKIENTLDEPRLYPLYARLVDTLETRFVKDTSLRLDLGEACAQKAWFSLLAGQYAAGEAAARRSMALTHLEPQIKCTLAHTLLFQNRFEEAKAAYLDFADDEPGNTDYIFDDFDKLRRNGVSHPDMPRIEALLGG